MIDKIYSRRNIIEKLSSYFVEETKNTIESTRFYKNDKQYYVNRILFFDFSIGLIDDKIFENKFREILNKRNDYENINVDDEFYKFIYKNSLKIYDSLSDDKLITIVKELELDID